MTRTTGRLTRALRAATGRRGSARRPARSSTPMSEALAIGLGLAPGISGRARPEPPPWQR